ncbi:DUF4238 domain-containing protein [Dactylosporangium sp. McL0621]|uniref:DUF4238 domain-containing protein n=1 Tax=Dactylosporangium sp. McL0621 TaxID=3415678 RepID=UPI003CF0F562
MTLQHYLPAAFLGRFSEDVSGSLRQRRVWVQRRDKTQAFRVAAEKIGAENNFYKLNDPQNFGQDVVDETWARYEQHLAFALARLITDAPLALSATLWLRVLVPFVAGTFVRTPAFDDRHNPLFGDYIAEGLWDELRLGDNTNLSRLTALNRLLGPMMVARWTVLHLPPQVGCITNDRGLANIRLGRDGRLGWIIPLDPGHILQLEPIPDGHGRKILYDADDGQWFAVIEHRYPPLKACVGLNDGIADAARDCIIGSARSLVESQQTRATWETNEPSVDVLPSPRMQMVHELDWHRAVSALRYSHNDRALAAFELDMNYAFSRANPLYRHYWRPSYFAMGINMPEFTPGLRVQGRFIEHYMSEVPGFTDYSPGPFPWEVEPPEGDVASR